MRGKILILILCLALVVSTITTVMVETTSAATAPTTSITITRWGANSTILFQDTIDYTAMEGNFSVKGDGVTHYWLEGPNYPWSGYPDMWDANETENLKDKGALKGTDLKDLCMWAGETDGLGNSTDTIVITASDGFYTTLPYANVYNPPAVQGPAVICWWWNGNYTGQGSFTSGMRLVFFAETTNAAGNYVYGDYDMGQTMPAAYQYFNYASHLPEYPLSAYPSTDGLSTKYVSNIDIYTAEVPTWTLQLDGTGIGGTNYTMTQQFFAEGIAHHGAASWVNTSWGGNDTYSGMPLWLLCGWVDDANEHDTGAFNDALAAGNYTVKVTDISGGYSTSLSSLDVARSDNFIIANEKNGAALTGSEYPLRLVGAGLSSKGKAVKQVAKIELIGNVTPTPTPTPTPIPTPTPTPGPVWNLQLIGAGNYTMTQSEFEQGVDCHSDGNASWATWVDGSNTWSGMPLWMLCGWVDDGVQHGSGAFNDALAAGNYTIKVIASDGFNKSFISSVVARNDNMIIANKLNGAPLPESYYPLRLVGPGLTGGQKVSKIVTIELIGLPTPVNGITRQVNGDILSGVSITIDGISPIQSNQSGQYQIMAATIGNHTVVAHKDGFRDRTLTINVTGLGTGYAVTCNFQGKYGLIPNAPDMEYVLDCINLWLFPPNQDTGLDIWTALDVVNAWLYPR